MGGGGWEDYGLPSTDYRFLLFLPHLPTLLTLLILHNLPILLAQRLAVAEALIL